MIPDTVSDTSLCEIGLKCVVSGGPVYVVFAKKHGSV